MNKPHSTQYITKRTNFLPDWWIRKIPHGASCCTPELGFRSIKRFIEIYGSCFKAIHVAPSCPETIFFVFGRFMIDGVQYRKYLYWKYCGPREAKVPFRRCLFSLRIDSGDIEKWACFCMLDCFHRGAWIN